NARVRRSGAEAGARRMGGSPAAGSSSRRGSTMTRLPWHGSMRVQGTECPTTHPVSAPLDESPHNRGRRYEGIRALGGQERSGVRSSSELMWGGPVWSERSCRRRYRDAGDEEPASGREESAHAQPVEGEL